MDVEDFVEPEIAVTAAVTAALFSPRARKLLRKGLVYGTAGVLAAGDAVASLTKSVSRSVQHAGAVAVSTAREKTTQVREEAKASQGTEQAASSEGAGGPSV